MAEGGTTAGETTVGGELVLGPVVRGAGAGNLSVWVETDRPGEVEVLGAVSPTFAVADHHYAIVELPAQEPGSVAYTVQLDGRTVWPPPGDAAAAPRLRVGSADSLEIMAGSCRQQAPEPLWLGRSRTRFGQLGPDALATLAHEIREHGRTAPDLLLLTGDQVYADEQHPSVRAGLRRRRGGPPVDGHPEVTSFDDYAWLYHQTWSHPLIRWLLSSVPSLMIFDDHDVIDDWNTSAQWVEEIAAEPWWADRIRAALMSYWVYQHLGNLSSADRRADPLLQAVRAADDGEVVLAAMAEHLTGTEARLSRTWSFHHRTDLVDLVVLDSRNGRVLGPERRSMLAPPDWELVDRVVGDAGCGPGDEAGRPDFAPPHLLVVSSVPWALPVGIHRLQQWASHLADGGVSGALARPAAWVGEQARQAIDLEHWAAFGSSYEDLRRRLARAAGQPGNRSVVVLSGDVHFGFIARIGLDGGRSIHQVVASPLRQVEMGYERLARRLSMGRLGRRVFDRIARRSAARTGPVAFELLDGPVFENNIATMAYTTTGVSLEIERATAERARFPRLERVARRSIRASGFRADAAG